MLTDFDSQDYTGANMLLKRLASQVGSVSKAVEILIKRGDMTHDGKLTDKGIERDNMTAEERALDRASRKSSYSTNDYAYNPITNRVKLNSNVKKEKKSGEGA